MNLENKSIEVFYSYAPQDNDIGLLDELRKQLSSLKRQGLVTE